MFTAPVSGFDAATDLRVTNGRVSVPPEGYGRNYEIMIIPESGEKRLVVQVLADVARSVRGWNGNVASEALSLTVNEAQAKGHYIPDVSPRNLARAPGVIASQSSSVSARGADKAIDGNIDGNSANGSISHTGTGTADRYQLWWQVDLGEAKYIDEIRLYNRLDCCANRASNFFVFVSNAPLIGDKLPQLWQEDVFYQRHHHGQMGHPTTLEVDRVERYVRVQLVGTQEPLHMAEVEVLGHDLPTPLPDLLNFRFPRPASRVATEAIEITEGVPFDVTVRFPTRIDRETNWHAWFRKLGVINGTALEPIPQQDDDRAFTVAIMPEVAGQPVVVQYPAGTVRSADGSYDNAASNTLSLPVEAPRGDGINLARATGAVARYSRAGNSRRFLAANAIDGNMENCTSTETSSFRRQPWWEVDLGAVKQIDRVRLYNTLTNASVNMRGFHVLVSRVPFASIPVAHLRARPGVFSIDYPGLMGRPSTVPVNRVGRYVRIQLVRPESERESAGFYRGLEIAEVEVIGDDLPGLSATLSASVPYASAWSPFKLTVDFPVAVTGFDAASEPSGVGGVDCGFE